MLYEVQDRRKPIQVAEEGIPVQGSLEDPAFVCTTRLCVDGGVAGTVSSVLGVVEMIGLVSV